MEKIKLPKPRVKGEVSLEAAIKARKSVRVYRNQQVSLTVLGQLLWAAQGVTHERIYRTAPSAGATFPLELYLIAGQVEGLDAGVYRYRCRRHEIEPVSSDDVRLDLATACHEQMWAKDAPLMMLFTAVFKRATGTYGERGRRFVEIEVGHAAENLMLQAAALGLGSCPMGAFEDDRVRELVGVAADEEPLLLVTVGR